MAMPQPHDIVATLLAGAGTAEIASAGTGSRVAVLQALGDGGTPVLLVRGSDLRVLGLPGLHEDVAVQLEIGQSAPLPDVTLPRAHLVLAGWASARPASDVPGLLKARSVTGDFAEAYRAWPDARVLTVDVAQAILHWSFGCADVDLAALAAAEPDPLARHEGEALAQVDARLGARLLRLIRTMGSAHGAAEGTSLDVGEVQAVRAVGLDRWGLVLRCLLPEGAEPPVERNIRLPFPSAVSTVDEAIDTLVLLALEHEACPGGCPQAGSALRRHRTS